MERLVCIHGHFYQPPRENPWLEAVEVQDGAHPYHDWNERITEECYAPNATSRILDEEKRIVKIVNNYERMSFDVGPTLLGYLESNAPETYASILEGDRLSRERYSGHGSAIFQPYNHMIMPLASARDKRTQLLWGIRDFQRRYKRPPEGMWLPETAVDLETLDMASSMGIRFTILTPQQALRTRRLGHGDWRDVSGGKVNTARAYSLGLPSGSRISVFFYNSGVSHAIAFEGLLNSGAEFALRLTGGFSGQRGELIHAATDGESYGHHHKFGDMALAFALEHIEKNGLARVTNYGEYLERYPPTHEVEIQENTSWSCAHGVERWRSDCGCSIGTKPKWNQKWRAHLRAALDYLRDELAGPYERAASELLREPWAARDDYIEVLLDRRGLAGFLERHAVRLLDRNETIRAVKLLELQRHLMLMYTSCGWFFDDISGIEAVQVLQYAGRAIQLSGDLFGDSREEGFLRRLEAAKSNVPEMKDGAHIYNRFVRPAVTDILKVGAHYAASSLFIEYPEEARIYCYSVRRLESAGRETGRARLMWGKCLVRSEITGEFAIVHFGVLHLGNHDFRCGARRFSGDEQYRRVSDELNAAFSSGAFEDVSRLMDDRFGGAVYTIRDLFRDKQRKILFTLLKDTIDDFESAYRRIYEGSLALMAFLREVEIPVPKPFFTATEFILNLDLKRELYGGISKDRINNMLDECEKWDAALDVPELEFALKNTLRERMERVLKNPSDIELLRDVERALDAALSLPFAVNIWVAQNVYFRTAKAAYRDFQKRAEGGDPHASAWLDSFRSLGEKLHFSLDAMILP